MPEHREPGMDINRIRLIINALDKEMPGVKQAFDTIRMLTATLGGAPVAALEQIGHLNGANKLIEHGLAHKIVGADKQEMIILTTDNMRILGGNEN